jgi:hypothetical protein
VNNQFEAESEHITRLVSHLARHVVPLFVDENGRPKRCGSGFLVSKDCHSYLISAAHVFDPIKNGEEIYFYIEPKLKRKLSGRARLTRMASGQDRCHDRFDIGVLQLDGAGLPPYPKVEKFALPVSALMPSALPRERKQYLLVGFPGTKTRLFEGEVRTTLYSYRNGSHPVEQYAAIGIAPQSHIALIFRQKQSIGPDKNIRAFPDPAEMSGSPIWLLYDEAGPNDPAQTPVVGVAIEHHPNKDAIVATDIGLALAYINAVG